MLFFDKNEVGDGTGKVMAHNHLIDLQSDFKKRKETEIYCKCSLNYVFCVFCLVDPFKMS